MDDLAADLERAAPAQLLLGYVNFSEGRPDARFEKALSDAFGLLAGRGVETPWITLHERLRARLGELQASGAAAFRDTRQAETVLSLVFEGVLPAYRAHHADLLFHQSERDLYQPFFLARVFETVLSLTPLQKRTQEVVAGALNRLNDYVGHRPIAILETRPKGEPYAHERVRPIPLYIRGAGVAAGRYHDLIAKTLEILNATDPGVLQDASFDLALLDELALDPRAYDHGHPANKRPNYIFGEWDPHHIDNRGRYRRFVVRQVTLDALLDRIERLAELPPEQRLFEAAAVLGGTILMAAGVSGAGPETHDSSVTLAKLIPNIARYRDKFYGDLLAKLDADHAARLREEAAATHQPFGGTRQHLNQYLARHRAAQMQQRHLVILLASMGYADASRRQAAQIPAASVRLLGEMHIRLAAGQLQVDAGALDAAAEQLPQVEDFLHRGIDCGALADPWNILGFQGLYPLFTAMEDSVRDHRIDELTAVVEQTFSLYARLLSQAAATGNADLGTQLTGQLQRLATWWDRFATIEVSEVRRVHGGEVVNSAEHVATALTHWRERDQAAADLGFWRQHLEGFRSPKAFALVVEALLRQQDYRAAMGLLMNWLSQAEQVPLEDNEHSFHALAIRWMLGVCQLASGRSDPSGQTSASALTPAQAFATAVKFFDYLEANADDYWNVPRLDVAGVGEVHAVEDEVEELYGAAYEGMTYEDSTDDDVESEVLEVGPQRDFDLDLEGRRLEKRLRFLATLARLWNIATRLTRAPLPAETQGPDGVAILTHWLSRARHNYQALLALMDAIHDHPIPEPSGGPDALVEYDQRRETKDRLLHAVIATSMDAALTVGALQGRLVALQHGDPLISPPPGTEAVPPPVHGQPRWEPHIIRLEQALWRGDVNEARALVPAFLELFKQEPLLYVPMSGGGHPRQILRASIAQTIMRALAANLPRLGLLRETYLVLRTAYAMEQGQPTQAQGMRVTEFARLFQIALQSAVEAVVDSAVVQPQPSQEEFLGILEALVHPLMTLWNQHSQTFLVATLETVRTDAEWSALRDFIQRYGHDLFHVRFLTFGNLRGILHRGVGAYLDYLRDNPDPLHPVRLIDELDREVPRADAERRLQIILQGLIENFEEYRDYNATSPQSDYGENLYILLDFLRLKAGYDRYDWQLRPLAQVHEVLARRQSPAALTWQAQFVQVTQAEADRQLERLARLEMLHGLRLRTVADRLGERFVRPLALDRLCALIPPAMAAAGHDGAEEAIARLEEELRPYMENPTGVGLDVPQWLQRLEATAQQVRASRTAIANLAENVLKIPKVVLPFEELRRQMQGWDKGP